MLFRSEASSLPAGMEVETDLFSRFLQTKRTTISTEQFARKESGV